MRLRISFRWRLRSTPCWPWPHWFRELGVCSPTFQDGPGSSGTLHTHPEQTENKEVYISVNIWSIVSETIICFKWLRQLADHYYLLVNAKKCLPKDWAEESEEIIRVRNGSACPRDPKFYNILGWNISKIKLNSTFKAYLVEHDEPVAGGSPSGSLEKIL